MKNEWQEVFLVWLLNEMNEGNLIFLTDGDSRVGDQESDRRLQTSRSSDDRYSSVRTQSKINDFFVDCKN